MQSWSRHGPCRYLHPCKVQLVAWLSRWWLACQMRGEHRLRWRHGRGQSWGFLCQNWSGAYQTPSQLALWYRYLHEISRHFFIRLAHFEYNSYLLFFLANSIASSMSLAYSDFWEAAKINEGLVVASCGLYCAMARLIANQLMSVDNPPYQLCLALTFKVTGIGDNGSEFLDLIEYRSHFAMWDMCICVWL